MYTDHASAQNNTRLSRRKDERRSEHGARVRDNKIAANAGPALPKARVYSPVPSAAPNFRAVNQIIHENANAKSRKVRICLAMRKPLVRRTVVHRSSWDSKDDVIRHRKSDLVIRKVRANVQPSVSSSARRSGSWVSGSDSA